MTKGWSISTASSMPTAFASASLWTASTIVTASSTAGQSSLTRSSSQPPPLARPTESASTESTSTLIPGLTETSAPEDPIAHKLPQGLIIGIACGGTTLFMLALFGIFAWILRRRFYQSACNDNDTHPSARSNSPSRSPFVDLEVDERAQYQNRVRIAHDSDNIFHSESSSPPNGKCLADERYRLSSSDADLTLPPIPSLYRPPSGSPDTFARYRQRLRHLNVSMPDRHEANNSAPGIKKDNVPATKTENDPGIKKEDAPLRQPTPLHKEASLSPSSSSSCGQLNILPREPIELLDKQAMSPPASSPPVSPHNKDNFKEYLLNSYTPSNYKVAPPDSVPRAELGPPPSLPQEYSAASMLDTEVKRESTSSLAPWDYLSAEEARGGGWKNNEES